MIFLLISLLIYVLICCSKITCFSCIKATAVDQLWHFAQAESNFLCSSLGKGILDKRKGFAKRNNLVKRKVLAKRTTLSKGGPCQKEQPCQKVARVHKRVHRTLAKRFHRTLAKSFTGPLPKGFTGPLPKGFTAPLPKGMVLGFGL